MFRGMCNGNCDGNLISAAGTSGTHVMFIRLSRAVSCLEPFSHLLDDVDDDDVISHCEVN